MRKILIASQKGGVGKTTTAVCLASWAARSGRVLLVDGDPAASVEAALHLGGRNLGRPLELEGFGPVGRLHCGVPPGFDVLLPSREGPASEGNLDVILTSLSSTPCLSCYDVVVVDAPPFLGAWSQFLLHLCNELVLVLRAEPLAYRTLPAYLEALRAARKHAPHLAFRGVLATLPRGGSPGGPWESRFRADLGAWILPTVIPYDESAGRALFRGASLVAWKPDAPAAVQYRRLAAALGLLPAEPVETSVGGGAVDVEAPPAASWTDPAAAKPAESGTDAAGTDAAGTNAAGMDAAGTSESVSGPAVAAEAARAEEGGSSGPEGSS